MNTVTFVSKSKVRSGLYEYIFSVNSEELTFYVEKRLHPDTGTTLGWMFGDYGHEDGGDYAPTKAYVLYCLCSYMLSRKHVKGLGWCASLDVSEADANELYQIVIK